jgi:type VI secretion system protein VasD
MIDRRAFLGIMGAGGLLAACQSGPPQPSTVTVNALGKPGMNAGPDGTDRPVTLLLLRLKSAGKLNSADLFALQADPGGVLGADLLGQDRLTVAPGGSGSKTLAFEPEATTLGVVALVRDPAGKAWRATQSISPGSTVTVTATLGPGGVSLSRG